MAAVDNVQDLFSPDTEQMASHLDHLFGGDLHGCHDGLVEIAWTDSYAGPDGRHRLANAQLFALDDFDAIVSFATSINKVQGHNTYVGAALRRPDTPFGKRAKDYHFYALTAFYADLDDPGVADRVKPLYAACTPTLGVVTGRKPHTRAQLWWRQEEPVTDPDIAKRQNLALALALGGDGVVVNPSRVMRLAGTIAWATKPGRTVERTQLVIPQGSPRIYMTGAVAKAFPPAADSAVMAAQAGSDAATPAAPGQIARLSPSRLLADIRAGTGHWHDKVLQLVAHWVNRGWADAEILAAAESLTLPGWTAQQTRAEVAEMVRGARQKWGIEEPKDEVEAAEGQAPLVAAPLGVLDPKTLKQREWVLGNRLIKGFVTLTIAPGGAGKTTLTMQEMLSIATGLPFTGQDVHAAGKVWVYNNEDPLDELQRRMAAICLRFQIDPVVIAERVFLNSGRDRRLLVAKRLNNSVVYTPDADALEEEIRRRGIVAMTIDPFVRVHQVEENDNAQIDAVADIFSLIGIRTGCAINLVHHTRKPAAGATDGFEGSADSSRGASSLVSAARIGHTLLTMSRKDAEQLGIPEGERRWFVRMDDAKGNMSPPAEDAAWFKRVGINLMNGPLGTEGDEIGVLEQWTPPDPAAITPALATAILEEIDKRWKQLNPYSQKGARSVIPLMQEHGLSEPAAQRLVKDWINKGMVMSAEYNPRTKQSGLKVMQWPTL